MAPIYLEEVMKNRKITIIVIILYSSVVDGVFECRRQKILPSYAGITS
jgi:hypothetical protein